MSGQWELNYMDKGIEQKQTPGVFHLHMAPEKRRKGRDEMLTCVIQVMALSAAINIWLILNEKITLWSLITSRGRD